MKWWKKPVKELSEIYSTMPALGIVPIEADGEKSGGKSRIERIDRSTGRSGRKLQASESIPKTTIATSNSPLGDKIWISDDACTCSRYLSNVQR